MYQKVTIILIITSTVFAFISCQKNQFNNTMYTATEEQNNFETRVYIRRQCLLSEEKVESVEKTNQKFLGGALAGIFVPLLIEHGLKAISSAIGEAGKEQELKQDGILPTFLYELQKNSDTDNNEVAINPDFGCLIIVRGSFDEIEPENPETFNYAKIKFAQNGVLDKKGQESLRIQRLNDNYIPVKQIAAIYEAEIMLSPEKNAYFYESRFLQINDFLGTRSSDKRGLVISIIINGMSTNEGDNNLSSALIDIGEVQKGIILGPNVISNKKSGWRKGLGMTDVQLTSLQGIELKSYSDKRKVFPVTIIATFIETDDGSATLRLIAKILDESNEQTTQAISDQIFKGDEREENRKTALEEMISSEETAYIAYLKAVQTLKGVNKSDSIAVDIAEAECQKAKRSWEGSNKALQKINKGMNRKEQSCVKK